jgi:phthiocerol/phenolphthiocerol synthesis type-I polyketide synthase E
MCGVHIYAELAEHYQGLRPVYGIFASEEVSFLNAEASGKSINFSLDALVESYKNALHRQGKPKALTLVGLSFGGLMCLEVARKLIAEGILVHNIYLLDSYTDISSYRSLRGLVEDTLKYIFSEGLLEMIKRILKMIHKRLNSQNSKTRKPAVTVAYDQKGREEAFDQAACVFMEAKNTYTFDCVLVKATDTDFGFGIRPYQDYRLTEYIKGNLYIHQVNADHEKMLAGECATTIYEIMQQYEPESAIKND